MTFRKETIPDALKSRDQWLMWDRSNETPRRPHWSGDFQVSWTDPAAWGSFDRAADVAGRTEPWGIGYVAGRDLDGHPTGIISFIDVDGAIDEDGELKNWVPDLEPFLEDGRYVEYSPSRDEPGDTGLHIPVVGADVPEWFTDQHRSDEEHEGIELLTSKFCTVTGYALEGAGDELARWSDPYVEEFLAAAYEAVSGREPPRDDGGDDSTPDDERDEREELDRDRDRDEFDVEDVEEMLEHIDAGCAYPKWRNIGLGLADHFPESTAKRLFRDWSRTAPSAFDDEAERLVDDIASRGSGDRTIGTVVYYAQEAGWSPSSSSRDVEIPTAKELVARESDEFDSAEDVPDDWFATDDGDDDREPPAPDELEADVDDSLERRYSFAEDVARVLEDYNEDVIEKQRARQRIAELLVDHFDFVRPEESVDAWRDTLYVYADDLGIYEPRGETFIKQRLEAAAGEFCNNQVTNEIVQKVARMTFERGDQFNHSPERLVVENGVLDLHTGELDEHTPDEYHRTMIPVAWNPDVGEPDAIDEFLHEIVDDDDVPTLYRMIAHSLYKEYVTEKAAMLVGSGQNGKSVFLDFVEHFLGSHNVTHRALQAFEDEFKANQLEGKLANIHPDMGDSDVKDMSTFKKLTGRDTFLADVKFEKPIEFENFATLMFAANEMPVFAEDNHAVWRRWIYIDFPYTFDPNDASAKEPEPKHQILDRLTDDRELEALLLRCQKEVQRWHEGEQWYPDAMEPREVRDKMKKAAEPVYAFATTCLEVGDEDDYVQKSIVRSAYRAFADEEGLPRIPENEFGQRLTALRDFPIEPTQRRDDGRRVHVYNGVRLSSRGRQVLGLDEPDDEQQTADEIASPKPKVLERLRELVDENDNEPVPEEAVTWSTPGVNVDRAEHALRELKESGDVLELDGGIIPN